MSIRNTITRTSASAIPVFILPNHSQPKVQLLNRSGSSFVLTVKTQGTRLTGAARLAETVLPSTVTVRSRPPRSSTQSISIASRLSEALSQSSSPSPSAGPSLSSSSDVTSERSTSSIAAAAYPTLPSSSRKTSTSKAPKSGLRVPSMSKRPAPDASAPKAKAAGPNRSPASAPSTKKVPRTIPSSGTQQGKKASFDSSKPKSTPKPTTKKLTDSSTAKSRAAAAAIAGRLASGVKTNCSDPFDQEYFIRRYGQVYDPERALKEARLLSAELRPRTMPVAAPTRSPSSRQLKSVLKKGSAGPNSVPHGLDSGDRKKLLWSATDDVRYFHRDLAIHESVDL
ncbi:hypothetical protein CF319_g7386 [Tilletia indica]|nr:hypothetical protein CF319_g7386 [Tilletia indica]